MKRDLSGKNVLVSNHFYYFGDKAIQMPDGLKGIIRQGQGHRSYSNQPFLEDFIKWVDSRGWKLNELYGKPQLDIFKDPEMCSACAKYRSEEK